MYWISTVSYTHLDVYKRQVLYREASTKGYSYLKCWQDANEQIQNVNNSLLSSNADISVLSNDQLLYSTLPQQKFRFEDFFAEQIVPSVYFTNAHQSRCV